MHINIISIIINYRIPRSQELNQPGENDGDTVIVKINGKVKAYRWSQRQYQWKLIGDIVEEATTSGKPKYNGVEYDFVFSVDLEDGAPLLKLPYNRGQNPDVVAQNFIIDNDLNPRYLKRVSTNNKKETIKTNVSIQYITFIIIILLDITFHYNKCTIDSNSESTIWK